MGQCEQIIFQVFFFSFFMRLKSGYSIAQTSQGENIVKYCQGNNKGYTKPACLLILKRSEIDQNNGCYPSFLEDL